MALCFYRFDTFANKVKETHKYILPTSEKTLSIHIHESVAIRYKKGSKKAIVPTQWTFARPQRQTIEKRIISSLCKSLDDNKSRGAQEKEKWIKIGH